MSSRHIVLIGFASLKESLNTSVIIITISARGFFFLFNSWIFEALSEKAVQGHST